MCGQEVGVLMGVQARVPSSADPCPCPSSLWSVTAGRSAPVSPVCNTVTGNLNWGNVKARKEMCQWKLISVRRFAPKKSTSIAITKVPVKKIK